MASAAPPILPVITPAGGGAATGSSSAPPISSSALRLFLSRISDTARRSLAHRRPWSELLDRSAFARPDTLSEATSRLRKNLGYFRVNYLALLAATLAISLLSHPFSLFLLLALLAAWAFLYLFRPADATPLVLFRRPFSDREILACLVLLTLLVVFLTSVGSLIVSALLVGAALVCVHGTFRVPEDLFLDDQDPTGPAGGFLSFLGGAAASSGTGHKIYRFVMYDPNIVILLNVLYLLNNDVDLYPSLWLKDYARYGLVHVLIDNVIFAVLS
ncbi:hypothetical protein ZIOFF_006789 [Zingiber officinale]|uniref:PRA1 family protein n=1 Tax=Zingiber officinale TaxID=94328 RepID=A0A8J5LPC0_ZINOF|nr:hypothetical protein ZIOFF_006789 [Zingiber officinale]